MLQDKGLRSRGVWGVRVVCIYLYMQGFGLGLADTFRFAVSG